MQKSMCRERRSLDQLRVVALFLGSPALNAGVTRLMQEHAESRSNSGGEKAANDTPINNKCNDSFYNHSNEFGLLGRHFSKFSRAAAFVTSLANILAFESQDLALVVSACARTE